MGNKYYYAVYYHYNGIDVGMHNIDTNYKVSDFDELIAIQNEIRKNDGLENAIITGYNLLRSDEEVMQKQNIWKEVTKTDFPDGNVLAACFDETSHNYGCKKIGEIRKNGNSIICYDGEYVLTDCTHYIDIDKHDL